MEANTTWAADLDITVSDDEALASDARDHFDAIGGDDIGSTGWHRGVLYREKPLPRYTGPIRGW
jgi:hypothetical protein